MAKSLTGTFLIQACNEGFIPLPSQIEKIPGAGCFSRKFGLLLLPPSFEVDGFVYARCPHLGRQILLASVQYVYFQAIIIKE